MQVLKRVKLILNTTTVRRCTSSSQSNKGQTSRIRKTLQNPLLKNMCTVGALYGAGDAIQQNVFQQKWDIKNTARISFVAATCFGPFLYVWYKWLDRTVVGAGAKIVVKKILLDQTVATPICTVAFYVGTSILEQRKDIFEELRKKALITYATGWAFWPAAQSINFLFLPTHLRATYVGFAALIWSNILCYIKAS